MSFAIDQIENEFETFLQTINLIDELDYDVLQVLEMAELTFENVMDRFPPCMNDTMETYEHLLFDPMGTDHRMDMIFDSDENLVINLLQEIENFANESDADQSSQLSETILLGNHHLWEAHCTQKYKVRIYAH